MQGKNLSSRCLGTLLISLTFSCGADDPVHSLSSTNLVLQDTIEDALKRKDLSERLEKVLDYLQGRWQFSKQDINGVFTPSKASVYLQPFNDKNGVQSIKVKFKDFAGDVGDHFKDKQEVFLRGFDKNNLGIYTVDIYGKFEEKRGKSSREMPDGSVNMATKKGNTFIVYDDYHRTGNHILRLRIHPEVEFIEVIYLVPHLTSDRKSALDYLEDQYVVIKERSFAFTKPANK